MESEYHFAFSENCCGTLALAELLVAVTEHPTDTRLGQEFLSQSAAYREGEKDRGRGHKEVGEFGAVAWEPESLPRGPPSL